MIIIYGFPDFPLLLNVGIERSKAIHRLALSNLPLLPELGWPPCMAQREQGTTASSVVSTVATALALQFKISPELQQ